MRGNNRTNSVVPRGSALLRRAQGAPVAINIVADVQLVVKVLAVGLTLVMEATESFVHDPHPARA